MNIVKIELTDSKGKSLIIKLDGSMDTVDFMNLQEMLNNSKITVDVLEYSHKEVHHENKRS